MTSTFKESMGAMTVKMSIAATGRNEALDHQPRLKQQRLYRISEVAICRYRKYARQSQQRIGVTGDRGRGGRRRRCG